MERDYDFSGWATKANMLCSDGRIIRQNAFEQCDGLKVPLVWNHRHNNPEEVLGHALLENRKEGVYAYCYFNNTESAQHAKECVQHGDINQLSIYANKLKQLGSDVIHGMIREVSLVHCGANPGAFIDSVIMHGDDSYEEGDIYTGEFLEYIAPLSHADEKKGEPEMATGTNKNESTSNDKTIKEIFNELTDEQQKAVYAVIGMVMEENGNDDDEDEEGGNHMKHNIFDQDTDTQEVLSHSEMTAIFDDAKRCGSLKDAVLAHGIEEIEMLFPDAQTLNNEPEFIKRDDDWVTKVLEGVHHSPFARIKTIFADITADEARAKGYVKGNLKVDEVFKLLKRVTGPTTIYKKQKLDRDDMLDITDFAVIPWLKRELRIMLNEELGRAILIGDGRTELSQDKINEECIRPIWKMEDLFTVKTAIDVDSAATPQDKAKAFITACIKSRKHYKGSGNPSMFMPEDLLTDCLLIEDANGRVIYDTVEKLASRLRVKEIISVPVMENQTRVDESADKTYTLAGIYVNLKDYNVGTNKGGEVTMFDDFDIDYNAQKYLMETRCSGTLVKPYSAVAIEFASDTE